MLDCLYSGVIPEGISGVSDWSVSNWDILISLVNGRGDFPKFYSDGLFWNIEESLGDEPCFKMRREIVSKRRFTDLDLYGLLGISFVDPRDTSVILTEGVSDYFTAKLLCPGRNVLGVTTLGGSAIAKKLVVNLFHSVCFCADNDVAGITNGSNWSRLLKSYGRECTIFTPVSSFKDITDNFIYNLKASKFNE